MAYDPRPKDHFDVKKVGRGSSARLEVTDKGYEERAIMLLELAYRTAFLNQPYSETIKSGMRSYFEKKWTAAGKAGVAKKVAQYAVAGGAFVVMTAVTGPTVLVLIGVTAGALALKKGVSYGIDKAGVKSVEDRLKKAGDPDAPHADSPSEVLPIMLEHGGIAKAIEHLCSHWRDIKLFKSKYGKKTHSAKHKQKQSHKREAAALSNFQGAADVEAWREWEGGTPPDYLDAAGKLINASNQFSAAGAAKKAKMAAKGLKNSVSAQKTDDNFMRLKIKKLTYYCSCVMDYCRHFQAEHAKIHAAVIGGWADLTRLVVPQAHVCGSHESCADDPPCFGGFGLLRARAEQKGCAELLDSFDLGETQSAAITGRLAKAHFTHREEAGQQTSRAAGVIRTKLGYDKFTGAKLKGAKKVQEKVTKKLIDASWQAATTGDLSGLEDLAKDPTGTGAAKEAAKDAILTALRAGEIPSPDALLNAPVGAPIVPCSGQIAEDLTDFFFSHYRENISARERMKLLTEGLQKNDKGFERANRIVADAMEAVENQNEQFFMDRLPTNEDMKRTFQAELISAANKIEHYVLKGDRRREKFVSYYEAVCGRGNLQSCEEGYELAYRFFNMLKTLWKLEQHIMFIYVFAKGVACALEAEAGDYYFPSDAAAGLAEWFEFWHRVPACNPARLATPAGSSSSSSGSWPSTQSRTSSAGVGSVGVYFSSSTLPATSHSSSLSVSSADTSSYSYSSSGGMSGPPPARRWAPSGLYYEWGGPTRCREIFFTEERGWFDAEDYPVEYSERVGWFCPGDVRALIAIDRRGPWQDVSGTAWGYYGRYGEPIRERR
ncbi:MAG: hypothetical protein H6811_01960 [Phycisphaeraceae bacterium]|nr:hypothetical protein [Phycisphaeraceae bacterium]